MNFYLFIKINIIIKMLIYEKISDTLIRVKIEPSTYLQSSSSFSEDKNNNKSILLNYFIPDAEMNVYLELTKENDNAFEETSRYKLPSEKWVYCKQSKKIESCLDFDGLELKRTDGNIYYYNRKQFKEMKKIEDTEFLYLAN